MALSFLPKFYIQDCFFNLKKEILFVFNEPNVASLMIFFEKNYVTDNALDWSCYNLVMQSLPITTNMCEGWNRAVNNTFLKAHPSIVMFLIEIRKHDYISEEKRRLYFQNFILEKK